MEGSDFLSRDVWGHQCFRPVGRDQPLTQLT